jgi:hypothetical protein
LIFRREIYKNKWLWLKPEAFLTNKNKFISIITRVIQDTRNISNAPQYKIIII